MDGFDQVAHELEVQLPDVAVLATLAFVLERRGEDQDELAEEDLSVRHVGVEIADAVRDQPGVVKVIGIDFRRRRQRRRRLSHSHDCFRHDSSARLSSVLVAWS